MAWDVPSAAYVWAGYAPTTDGPSPNCHIIVSASPSGSDGARPSKWTGTPTLPAYGPPASAVGGRLGGPTSIRVIAEPDRAFAAVKWTAKVPTSAGRVAQANAPDVWSAFTANDTSLPAGRPDRSA